MLRTALGDSGLRAVYQETVTIFAEGISADRAVLVYLDDSKQLAVGAVYGLPRFTISDAPISTSVLREVIQSKRNLIYSDVREDLDLRGNVSLLLSGAVSILCLPFYDEAGTVRGVLYADTIRKTGAFRRKELLFARDCAIWLEACSAGRDNVCRPEVKIRSDQANPTRSPRDSVSMVPEKRRRSRLGPTVVKGVSAANLMVFFRSLATLTQAGVMLHEGLGILARSSDDPRLAEIVDELSGAVFRGEPLSSAMERYPNAFPSYLRSAIRVGERTGRLVHVLDVLSTDLEKSQRLVYRMKSALTYPFFLSVACGLILLLGPPYLLDGHLRVLLESGVPLPFLTRAMIVLSKLLGNPLFLLLLGIGVFLVPAYLCSDRGRKKLFTVSRRLPVVGTILAKVSLSQFSRLLCLQLRAGLTALEALGQARLDCRDPKLREALRLAEDGLRNGDSLAEALQGSGYFSPSFLSFVEAGEVSGTLVKLTEWVADFQEQELEMSLDRFVTLVEPLIMALMGLVTTVLLVATLKPTLLILQTAL
mgnify:CR=1 FL=1